MSWLVDQWADRLLSATLQGGVALLLAVTITRLLPRMPAVAKVWTMRFALLKLILAAVFVGGLSFAMPSRPDHILSEPSLYDQGMELLLPTGFALWILSVSFGVYRHLRNRRNLWNLVHMAEEVRDALALDIFREICSVMSIPNPPALRMHAGIASPLLIQNGCTTVLLPQSLIQDGDRERLEAAIAHELAHHRHHDLRWGWLLATSDILFFFHPLVGMTLKKLRLYEECAADSAAMKATAGCPSTYSRTLLSFAESGIGLTGACAMAEDALELDTRIKALYASRKSPHRVHIVLACLALVVSSGALLPWTVRHEERWERTLGRLVSLTPYSPSAPRSSSAAGGG